MLGVQFGTIQENRHTWLLPTKCQEHPYPEALGEPSTTSPPRTHIHTHTCTHTHTHTHICNHFLGKQCYSGLRHRSEFFFQVYFLKRGKRSIKKSMYLPLPTSTFYQAKKNPCFLISTTLSEPETFIISGTDEVLNEHCISCLMSLFPRGGIEIRKHFMLKHFGYDFIAHLERVSHFLTHLLIKRRLSTLVLSSRWTRHNLCHVPSTEPVFSRQVAGKFQLQELSAIKRDHVQQGTSSLLTDTACYFIFGK